MRGIARTVCAVLTLLACPYAARTQEVTAYVGTGLPDITDDVFDGTASDIVSGSGELGNYLFLTYDSAGTPLTLDHIAVDFGPSADADIEPIAAGPFTPDDHLDGVIVSNRSVAANVFTADFANFVDGVNLFYLMFDYDKRSFSGGGTPLGGDYQGATIALTLSDGTVLNGTFTQIDIFGAGAFLGVGGGPVDVWLRDCAADDGTVSSLPNCPEWYTSPDIFTDTAAPGAGGDFGDMVIDTPAYGERNRLKAIVRNRNTGFAQSVAVSFYYRNNHTGLNFADGATLIGTTTVNLAGLTQIVTGVDWTIPAPPTDGHWCIGVVLSHAADPQTSTFPPEDNNVACANIWFIAGRAGETVTLSFLAGSAGRGGFGLSGWPHEFILTVDAQVAANWKWRLEGIKPGETFTVKEGESRPVRLLVEVPRDASPHEAVGIAIVQRDAATNKPVGGVHYDLYEDHRPPARIGELHAVIAEGKPRLTWERVRFETETGLRERIARYEVLRDGNLVATVIRDEDPRSYGIQWTDSIPPQGEIEYAVRAVDEGGNVAAPSEALILTLCAAAPGKGTATSGTWPWIIAILILLLIVVALLRRRR